MRILLVEDHALFRDAVSLILAQLEEDVAFVFAGTAAEARSACTYYQDLDLIMIDLNLPDESGLTLLPELREQTVSVPVVVVSASEDPADVHLAMAAGAAAYVPKKSTGPELLAAIRSVLAGDTYVPLALLSASAGAAAVPPSLATSASASVVGDVPHESSSPATSATSSPRAADGVLSLRQRQVLKLLAAGLPNKLIARELNLSEGTIKLHVSAIIHALNTRNRTEAVMEAERRGLLDTD